MPCHVAPYGEVPELINRQGTVLLRFLPERQVKQVKYLGIG